MMSYAVWRFVAELMRNDYRGATIVDFLTPSQFVSVLLLAGGFILLGIELYVDGKKSSQSKPSAEELDESEAIVTEPAEGESHD
jgi:prolipoprotein diacylglyceryltransferase